jgi:soluble lytic murein transglycosylase-like protein
MGRLIACTALLGLLAAPHPGAAGEIYSYVDADGVIHFSNAPSDAHYRKVARFGPKPTVQRLQTARREARAPAPETQRVRSYAEYEAHVRTAAERYKLPVGLLRAVMAVESNFDHLALSQKGAMGLMQLMPGTARDMYVSDAWDPAQNIEGGARYLRILANLYDGDVMKTLAAYNAGPEAVKRAGGVPNIPETQNYVRKVLALYQLFREGA